MDIGVLRDFVIVIGGFLLLVLIILAGILGFLIYRNVNSLIKSARETIETAKELSSNAKEAMGLFKLIMNYFKGKKASTESQPSSSKDE